MHDSNCIAAKHELLRDQVWRIVLEPGKGGELP
jgi:hypothetical protein